MADLYSGRFKKLEGFDQMMKSYRNEIYKLKAKTLKGLIKAQSIIRESMDTTRPLIPVESGNLRNSWFCATSNGAVISGKNPKFSNLHNDEAQLYFNHSKAVGKATSEALIRGKNYGPFVVFGLSAYYGSYVEHMYSRNGSKIKWTRFGSGPEFFIGAINRTRRKVLRIIAQDVSIK
jgi:hypothetical protein